MRHCPGAPPPFPPPVAPVLSLPVDLWVEVHVMKDDCVRPRQVQALASGPGGQQEEEDVVVWVVEAVTQVQTVVHLGGGG